MVDCGTAAASFYTISDIHTDFRENYEWLRHACEDLAEANPDGFKILLVAGDVSDTEGKLIQTFDLFSNYFDLVFFIPGNHDVWLPPKPAAKKENDNGTMARGRRVDEDLEAMEDSLGKYKRICAALKEKFGVLSSPHTLRFTNVCEATHQAKNQPTDQNTERIAIRVVPMHGWHNVAFDCEPDIPLSEFGGAGPPALSLIVRDRRSTRWPSALQVLEEEGKRVGQESKNARKSGMPAQDDLGADYESSLRAFDIRPEMSDRSDWEWNVPSIVLDRLNDTPEIEIETEARATTAEGVVASSETLQQKILTKGKFTLTCCPDKCSSLKYLEPLERSITPLSLATSALSTTVEESDSTATPDTQSEDRGSDRTLRQSQIQRPSHLQEQLQKQTQIVDQNRCQGGKESEAAFTVSMSHFLPFPFLNPEKRNLFYPPLAKVIGSEQLGHRVLALLPDVHIFGHTHFGWNAKTSTLKHNKGCLTKRADAMFERTRFLQVPLSKPKERELRASSLRLRGFFSPDGEQKLRPFFVVRWGAADTRTNSLANEASESAPSENETSEYKTPVNNRFFIEDCLADDGTRELHGSALWSQRYQERMRTPSDTRLAPWVKECAARYY